MATPIIIDTVRSIPLIIEKEIYEPMSVDENNCEFDETGFPFDRDFDRPTNSSRSDSFRSTLDDLAARHPEFADHFDEFPFRRHNTETHHRPTTSQRTNHSDAADDWFNARPSAFERFGFPSPSTFTRPEQQQQHETHPKESPAPEKQENVKETEIHQPEKVRKNNIQQSQTVDLGQKQEPEVDERGQRSMSAPPSDNRSGKRFVSSINIPIGPQMAAENMGAHQSQEKTPQNSSKSNERVIPIHVEGRDEPVLPKNANFTPKNANFTPQNANFTPQNASYERVFGQNAADFTKFVPKPAQATGEQQEEGLKQQQAPEKVPEKAKSPIDVIQLIQKDVSDLMGQVEKFEGMPKDKKYMYLDEMLTRNLLKLDNIDTQGQENIRMARKEAVRCIEKCLAVLDAKAAANFEQKNAANEENISGEKMQVDEGAKEDGEQKENEEDKKVEEIEVKNLEEEKVEK